MTNFSDLALDPRVVKAVTEAGYDTPTPIQERAIPEALKGRDVLGIAQTGTGKTAGFTLPMITLLRQGRARARMPRSLILAPTRELATQVGENFETYAKYTRLTKALLIGGVSFNEQDRLIDRGVDVLIATPGRLLDHFERGKLLLTGVQILVVDEADRMLDMGFIPDIERIFQLTPFTRQTLFFSATMAPEIERITNTFLSHPARIEIARQATASRMVEQRLIFFRPTRKDRTFTEKRAVLREVIRSEGENCTNAIIFCNRKVDVDVVAKSLKVHGFNAAPLHGDLAQSERTKTLDAFREGEVHLLVASDVAARGLDIPDVSHVFNFNIPSHAEDYIHRIGRTGRAGRHGIACSIATPADDKTLAAVEVLLKHEIPRFPVPEGLDLASAGGLRATSQRRERGAPGKGRGGRRTERRTKTEMAQTSDAATESKVTPKPDKAADAPAAHGGRDAKKAAGDRRGRTSSRGRATERKEREPGLGPHTPDFLLRSLKRPGAAQKAAEKPADGPDAKAEKPAARKTATEKADPD